MYFVVVVPLAVMIFVEIGAFRKDYDDIEEDEESQEEETRSQKRKRRRHRRRNRR